MCAIGKRYEINSVKEIDTNWIWLKHNELSHKSMNNTRKGWMKYNLATFKSSWNNHASCAKPIKQSHYMFISTVERVILDAFKHHHLPNNYKSTQVWLFQTGIYLVVADHDDYKWPMLNSGGFDGGGRLHRVEWTMHGNAGHPQKSKTRGRSQ